jgi:hypothetical protein
VTVQADRVSATAGNITTASRSTIVQIVSRCIVARSCAIGTASTVCASPSAKAAARRPPRRRGWSADRCRRPRPRAP